MKECELDINRKCHVVYTKKCKNVILKYLGKHYRKDEIDSVFTAVQKQFVEYLKPWRTDLGGKKNPRNGVSGTYDCIMFFSYYVVCKDVTSFEEIEKMCEEIFLEGFRRLSFVDANRPFFKKLLYVAFTKAKKRCDKWPDYEMTVEPYRKGEPLRYKFTSCPVAEFAREHGLVDILPALCNVDYPSLEVMHARLVRTTTLGKGDYCDYAIVGDRDPYLEKHPEYRDENGGRWNK